MIISFMEIGNMVWTIVKNCVHEMCSKIQCYIWEYLKQKAQFCFLLDLTGIRTYYSGG